MLYKTTLEFKFKGSRDYVQGPDIYSSMLAKVKNYFGENPSNIEGSFHRLLRNNGVLCVYKNEELPYNQDVFALFTISVQSKDYRAAIFDAGTRICSSYDYDEEKVLDDSIIKQNTILMQVKTDYTYMEQIVAMTKKLHLTIYPDAQGKWLFTKIQIKDNIDPSAYSKKMLSIKSERNFQNKLTQCKILINDKTTGNIFFSLAT